MIERLGLVIYWGTNVVAALTALAAAVYFRSYFADGSMAALYYGSIFAIWTALIWLVGRAARFVLVGD